MDESMIERVARALRQHDCDEVLKRDNVSIPDWESDPDLERREAYRRSARAAIEAMREPTNAMVKAHKGARYRANGQSASKTEAIREGHRAAIDSALSEKP